MRVVIGVIDEQGLRRARQAALDCWGGPKLVQVSAAPDDVAIMKRLTARVYWPDVILTSVPFLERYEDLVLVLRRHPGRGHYRWLVWANGLDEHLHAALHGFGDAVIEGPLTADLLSSGLHESRQPAFRA